VNSFSWTVQASFTCAAWSGHVVAMNLERRSDPLHEDHFRSWPRFVGVLRCAGTES
jgi:hypothetical protein